MPLPSREARYKSYRSTTLLFGIVMLGLGAAMIVGALARGGGPLSLGVLLGLLFGGLGIARLYILRKTPPA